MATKYGLAIAAPFVKGTAGSTMETLRRNHNKDNLIQVASSLGWLVRDTLGVDTFRACLNLVESSPACGGGMERLAKAYRLNRLGPYKEGALNAAKISSEDFVAHMAKHGLNSYGEPLEDEEVAAAAAAALAASSQQQRLHTQQGKQWASAPQQPQEDSNLFSQDPGTSLFAGGEVNGGKVRAPRADDDLDRVVDVDDPHDDAGNVRVPAATDPLLARGTVGRTADQSQVQAGSQVQGRAPADTNKKKLCKTVWRDDVCTDWSCDRAHPPGAATPSATRGAGWTAITGIACSNSNSGLPSSLSSPGSSGSNGGGSRSSGSNNSRETALARALDARAGDKPRGRGEFPRGSTFSSSSRRNTRSNNREWGLASGSNSRSPGPLLLLLFRRSLLPCSSSLAGSSSNKWSPTAT